MKLVKEICIIFGFTMAGELLNYLLPLPVPAGVYGLFLLLAGLLSGVVKLSDVESSGKFLLDAMPVMFIPVSVGLMENFDGIRQVWIPLTVISAASTVIVMAATGKAAQFMINRKEKKQDESFNDV